MSNGIFTLGPEVHSRFDPKSPEGLVSICALARINALACIMSAGRGWLGASYSVTELLCLLYFRMKRKNIILSKGHASAMQYACLYGNGLISRDYLLSYKDGPEAPQAHTDMRTPGILFNTGSLGQALSKTAAIALCRPEEVFYVILGDGELQEGQIFEALQTIHQRRLKNLIVVVDVNGFQSARLVSDIKEIPDFRGVFEGFGFEVRDADGHDPESLYQSLGAVGVKPLLVLSRTIKAGGSRHLLPQGDLQKWHGAVPDRHQYLEILSELVEQLDAQSVSEFARFSRRRFSKPEPSPKSGLSTRDAFSLELQRLMNLRKEIVLLDGDLVDSCRLSAIADPNGEFVERGQFFQMGISEQDMFSFAGGLALCGKLPVVSTYAAFFKRAMEQIHVNGTESSRIIYAGQYAGLCYFTDGKTHQSLDDMSLMSSLHHIKVVEPLTPWQTSALLKWATESEKESVYFRLRRTPLDIPFSAEDLLDSANPRSPLCFGSSFQRVFICSGTVSTRLAFDCIQEPDMVDFGVLALCELESTPELDLILRNADEIISIEESPRSGPLRNLVLESLHGSMKKNLFLSKFIDGWGGSFRTLDDCREHFGFTVDGIRSLRSSVVDR